MVHIAQGWIDRTVRMAHLVEQIGQVFDMFRDDISDDALPLELTRNTQQPTAHHFGPILRESALSPDDDVGRAGLILQCEKDDA